MNQFNLKGDFMSKDDFTAEDIFNIFQSRREVLARTGKLAAAQATVYDRL